MATSKEYSQTASDGPALCSVEQPPSLRSCYNQYTKHISQFEQLLGSLRCISETISGPRPDGQGEDAAKASPNLLDENLEANRRFERDLVDLENLIISLQNNLGDVN